jgi:iron complex outermembrane receptor protein
MTISVLTVITHVETSQARDSRGHAIHADRDAVHVAQLAASDAPTEPVEFNIPSQPLNSAITAFADQANYRLLVSSDMTEGLSTNGVTGRHTPEEAIGLLLAGTGLAYRLTEANTITLERPTIPVQGPSGQNKPSSRSLDNSDPSAQDGQRPVKVPQVIVKDIQEHDYAVDDASTATRIPAPIQDTPRSVEVITRQVIDDQKVIRFSDALRNVSGTFQSSTQGGQGGVFMIRGFASDLNVFKNGFRDDSTFSSRVQRDIINIDRIEVVKGPPSYLFGRSDPGGVINQITKAPLRNPYYSGEMIIGSYGLYRPTIDIGGPLNESKTLTYRLNAMYESAESYRDGVQSHRFFITPTFGWELGSRTTFRFEGEYLYDRSPIDRGLVAFGNGVAPIPISRFLGDPTRRGETQQGKATLTLLHQFNDMFRWRTAFRAAVTKSGYSSLESNVLDESTGILTLARYEIPTTVQSHYLQNELHGSFATGSIKHSTLLGIELGREVSSAQGFGDLADWEVLSTFSIPPIACSWTGLSRSLTTANKPTTSWARTSATRSISLRTCTCTPAAGSICSSKISRIGLTT